MPFRSLKSSSGITCRSERSAASTVSPKTLLVNIKLTIEYDGTRYHGWQIQPNAESIQAILERAVSTFLGTPTCLTAAGRTDAGVHALGQVANFYCVQEPDLVRLQRGLNALTPEEIVIKRVESVADSFDARRDARSRVYQYRIWNAPFPSAFHLRYSWHVYDKLDLLPMSDAVRALEGEHDFSFLASGCDAVHAIRKICRNSLDQEGDFVLYTIEATAFLRHMVRNIIGTLVEVGRGERPPEDFVSLLQARDRARAGPTAPARGLFLVEVKY
ncbi:MAG TPA: tRNA pseudouridine(38-40) synthase TruA [Candidatus Binatia bacterium]|nr:tRNA pseudouridine(38-40) synthase TruA [Candidatus Binatia bacterium]